MEGKYHFQIWNCPDYFPKLARGCKITALMCTTTIKSIHELNGSPVMGHDSTNYVVLVHMSAAISYKSAVLD